MSLRYRIKLKPVCRLEKRDYLLLTNHLFRVDDCDDIGNGLYKISITSSFSGEKSSRKFKGTLQFFVIDH